MKKISLAPKSTPLRHIGVMFFLLILLFHGFFKKGVMMNSLDQVDGVGLKRPFQESLIKDHEFPHWNRSTYCGMPISDAIGGDFLYPFNFLTSFLVPAQKAFGVKMILHIFLAGIFFYFMLWKAFAFPPSIALIGALFFMFNPQFVSHITPGHDGKMYVIAWVPFLIWQLKSMLDRPRLLPATLLGLGIGMIILTCHVQMAYFALWGVFAYWLMHTLSALFRREFKHALKCTAGFWGAVAIGLGLSSIQLLPALGYIHEHLSIRSADRTLLKSASWGLHWADVISLWIPEYGNWFGWYWGNNTFKLNTEYAGAVATLLALLALLHKRTKWRIFWLVVALFTLLLSLSKNTPLFYIVYAVIPGVKKFRALSMIMFWHSFSMVFLGSLFLKDLYGEFWKKISDKALTKWKITIIVLIVLSSAAALLFSNEPFARYVAEVITPGFTNAARRQFVFAYNFKEQFLPHLRLWWGFTTIILILLYLLFNNKIPKKPVLTVLLAIGLFDLFRVDYKFISTKDIKIKKNSIYNFVAQKYDCNLYMDDHMYSTVPPSIEKLQKEMKREPFRVILLSVWNEIPSANFAGVLDLEGLSGYHENELAVYNHFRGGKGDENYLTEPAKAKSFEEVKSILQNGANHFNIANCKYYICPKISTNFKGDESVEYIIIENENFLPRLAFTNCYHVCDTATMASLLKKPEFNARNTVLLDREPPIKIDTVALEPNRTISSTWEKYTANHRIASFTVETRGLLRISEVFYPGWQIYLNGKEVTPLKADIAWMALPVEAGTQKLEMKMISPFISKTVPIFLITVILLGTYWAVVLYKHFSQQTKSRIADKDGI